jgi:hypothetical protein
MLLNLSVRMGTLVAKMITLLAREEKISEQDKTWVEFSSLDVGRGCGTFKTRPKQILASLTRQLLLSLEKLNEQYKRPRRCHLVNANLNISFTVTTSGPYVTFLQP